MFFTNWLVPEISSPLVSPMLNGRGDSAWFGWPEDATIENLKAEFIAASSPADQLTVAKKIQAHNMEQVLYIPVGQYALPQARRSNIVDMLPSPVPVFWNVKKE